MSLPDEQIRAVQYMHDVLMRFAEPGRIRKGEFRAAAFRAVKHCPFAGTLEVWHAAYERECAAKDGKRTERR